MKDKLSTTQWIEWLSATVIAVTTLTAFMFMNFETKGDARERKEAMSARLDRLESKIDRLLEHMK